MAVTGSLVRWHVMMCMSSMTAWAVFPSVMYKLYEMFSRMDDVCPSIPPAYASHYAAA